MLEALGAKVVLEDERLLVGVISTLMNYYFYRD
jgi:hypothetical protein